VAALLDAVGMDARGASMPRELSGGEMQRVAIARALIHRPAVVLADEPTGNLDAESAAGVMELLRGQLRQHGATGVLVTHSRAAAALCDRVLTLTADGLRETSLTDSR
jgi:putative ABC transport system ATP-binding protein